MDKGLKKLRFLFRIFSRVTCCVVIATAFFTTVLNPVDSISPMILWQIPGVSMLCSLGSFLYPWDGGMTKREMGFRIFLHYLYINGVVLTAGRLFDWYDARDVWSILAMVITIGIIFAVVSAISWRKSAKDAKNMNERLQERGQ